MSDIVHSRLITYRQLGWLSVEMMLYSVLSCQFVQYFPVYQG